MKRYSRIFFVLMAVICMGLMFPVGSNVVTSIATSNQKNSKLIVIDPGHGGFDPGKVGVNDALEKDINLSISFKLKTELEKEGYQVELTRTTDTGLYSEGDKSKKSADMRNRVKIINDAEPFVAISIHQNSYPSESVKGAQVFYHKLSEDGKMFADIVQERLKEELNDGNKRIAKANDNYYMLKKSECPLVIVECGFLSNNAEAKLLVDEAYQQKLAVAIKNGVLAYAQKKNG
ncbi:MAG: N-acetylmuramoyl-L-alanine amidase CwlD [bacterium]|nr:N-acetylmuramoyl-L-alanine amidase CwlD [bacterium]